MKLIQLVISLSIKIKKIKNTCDCQFLLEDVVMIVVVDPPMMIGVWVNFVDTFVDDDDDEESVVVFEVTTSGGDLVDVAVIDVIVDGVGWLLIGVVLLVIGVVIFVVDIVVNVVVVDGEGCEGCVAMIAGVGCGDGANVAICVVVVVIGIVVIVVIGGVGNGV